MEGEEKKSGWKIWVYLTPVYLIIAIPLVLWMKKINSSDLELSREEYNVFNTDEGEIKRRQMKEGYDPGLADRGYAVRYRSDGAEPGSMAGDGAAREGTEQAKRQAAARQQRAGRSDGGDQQAYNQKLSRQAALESDDTKKKEQMGLGYRKGYLTTAVGKVMKHPKAVKALLNNQYIVKGFMSRGTVKAATASPEALANYLKGSGPSNFINNPIVKAALNNPAIVSAVASSGMVSAFLDTPAAQALMKDPDALGQLVNDNPQLMQLAMQNPQTLSMLMNNPDVASQLGKFDTSKIGSR